MGVLLPAVPVDQNPPGPDAYEEVTNGAQTGGLGKSVKSLRCGLGEPQEFGSSGWSLGLRLPFTYQNLMAREGVLGEFTLSHPNFSLFSQASTCALDDPKGHGILQRSGRGCECCRAIVVGLLPPCCCALCWKWDLWVCIKIKVSQGRKKKIRALPQCLWQSKPEAWRGKWEITGGGSTLRKFKKEHQEWALQPAPHIPKRI